MQLRHQGAIAGIGLNRLSDLNLNVIVLAFLNLFCTESAALSECTLSQGVRSPIEFIALRLQREEKRP